MAIALVLLLLGNAPVPAQTRAFTVSTIGNGPPMILIPGLTSPGSVWDGTVNHFKDKYTCHVLTLAGFAGVPPVREPSIGQVRSDLIQYIRDQHLDPVVLVGHSVGRFIAYWVAATAPDRVKAVIALDGATFLPALFSSSATVESAKAGAERMREAIVAMTPERFQQRSDAEIEGQILNADARAPVAAAARLSDPATTARFLYELYTTDLRAPVKAITAPVLLLVSTNGVVAEAKEAYLASAKAQLENIASTRIVEVPEARHFIQLDAPAAFFAAADDFLRTLRK